MLAAQVRSRDRVSASVGRAFVLSWQRVRIDTVSGGARGTITETFSQVVGSVYGVEKVVEGRVICLYEIPDLV
jgi:hypothetical protein